jgi:hypothetical protein
LATLFGEKTEAGKSWPPFLFNYAAFLAFFGVAAASIAATRANTAAMEPTATPTLR